jgi:hypothetical protein
MLEVHVMFWGNGELRSGSRLARASHQPGAPSKSPYRRQHVRTRRKVAAVTHRSAQSILTLLLAIAATSAAAELPVTSKKLSMSKAVRQKPTETGALDANGVYQLGASELKLDCKKLSGRIQLRLLTLRDAASQAPSSFAARAIHGTAGAVLGGSSVRANPETELSRDRAMVEAYNRQLAAKGCKTFDIEAELRKPTGLDTPAPRAQKVDPR